MLVGEYIIFEMQYGVELDMALRKVKELKSEEELITICGSAILRKCLLRCYKLFPKLESISEEEKKELWQEARDKFPGKKQGELIENCKIIYTVGKLIGFEDPRI
jgi:hypothetical protein